jgi:hypothetical protein
MSEHTWFEENLSTYNAGGLTPSERERFERHAASCKDCARSLNDWTGFDRSLDDLFAEVRPEAGLENRLLQGLRTVPARRRRWPMMIRAAAAVAALVILGVFGAVMQNLVESDSLPFPGLWAEGSKTEASNNLKQIALVDDSRSMKGLMHGTINHGLNFSPDGHQVAIADGSVRTLSHDEIAFKGFEDLDGSITGKPNLGFITRGPSRVHTSTEGGLIGGKQNRDEIAKHEAKERGLDLEEGREVKLKRYRMPEFGMINESTLKPVADLYLGGRAEDKKNPWSHPKIARPPIDNNQNQHFVDEIQKSEASVSGVVDSKEGRPMIGISPGLKKLLISEPAYFKPAESEKAVDKVVNKVPKEKPAPENKPPPVLGQPNNDWGEGQVAAGEKGKPPPATTGRKIVRSGDVEYEVDSFDAAVERVHKLVDLVKGGYVATVNSDKLANGKVKGSVVVRLPPESLDKFLADLRKDLGKTGDLKSMRIGSQDITKQYTDVESRLRAAKTMEERLLQIIKSGKGEIKDLVVAEEKLGIVRTKIEEMEGEIRYYNNQVSLSKLTIGLTEKEIRAASGLEVTEKIKMRIEVDQVEKAQETVLDEVKKAKGRVIKSDLKQHGAGQLEAIMIFEVKPEHVPELRKVLKNLGNITKDEVEKQQTAVGGAEPAADIKRQVKDTNFEVRLYNLANVQPRETLTLIVATLDVATSYKKLQEAVKGKGQVINGQFNAQDKLNVSAALDFNLHVKDRAAIDKVLAEVGKEIGRDTKQAQPSENVTDQKIGYRLTLLSVASIAPRESIILEMEVKKVEQTAAELVDQVKSLKGLVADGPLFQIEPNGQVSARVRFAVPLSAKDELAKSIKAAGVVRLQRTSPNPKVPDNELATATILVILTNPGPIVPSEDALGPQIRKSLFYSFKIFSISLSFVLLGILGILPPALVLFGAYKLVRKWQKKSSAA